MEIPIGVCLIVCFLCFVSGYACGREDGVKRGVEIVKAAQKKEAARFGYMTYVAQRSPQEYRRDVEGSWGGRLEVLKMDEALNIWREWFEWSGNPWVEDDYGKTNCFFCGETEPNHAPSCAFIKAQTLCLPNKDINA